MLFGVGGLVVGGTVLGGFDVLGGALYEDVLAVEDAVGSVGAFEDDFGVGVEEEVGEDAVVLGGDEPDAAILLVGEGEVRHGGAVGTDECVLDEAAADADELAFGRGTELGEFADGVGVHGCALEGDEAEVEERAEQHDGCDDEFQVQQADFLMCGG